MQQNKETETNTILFEILRYLPFQVDIFKTFVP